MPPNRGFLGRYVQCNLVSPQTSVFFSFNKNFFILASCKPMLIMHISDVTTPKTTYISKITMGVTIEKHWKTYSTYSQILGLFIFVGESKARRSGPTTNNQEHSVSRVTKQEEKRCHFCDVKLSSVSQLHHYSSTQHKVNAMRQLHAKSKTEFRLAPDGIYKGRYKLCRRLEMIFSFVFHIGMVSIEIVLSYASTCTTGKTKYTI